MPFRYREVYSSTAAEQTVHVARFVVEACNKRCVEAIIVLFDDTFATLSLIVTILQLLALIYEKLSLSLIKKHESVE